VTIWFGERMVTTWFGETQNDGAAVMRREEEVAARFEDMRQRLRLCVQRGKE
jgi:hypothetical protein